MKITQLCSHPIIQAPMAGGATTPELVAAVSNAGALGSLAAPLLTPLAIIEQAEHIRRLTDQPFAINLFVQTRPQIDDAALESAKQLLQPIWQSLGWDGLPTPTRWCEDFDAQLDALLIARPAVASFTFDILHASQIQRLHDVGILVVGTATNLAEAQVWQAMGADAICLQGVEAGGHRGTFIGQQEDASLGIMALLQQVQSHSKLPLIAAGGIMHGRDIAQALQAGAQMVQMGTAFLTTDEAAIHPAYKAKLLELASQDEPDAKDAEDATMQTRAFSGRIARGVRNRFIQTMQAVAQQVPAYPIQNALTGSLRAHAAKTNDTDLMSMWAGQGVHRVRQMTAATLIATLVAELQQYQSH